LRLAELAGEKPPSRARLGLPLQVAPPQTGPSLHYLDKLLPDRSN
jgi:hypothetical protein